MEQETTTFCTIVIARTVRISRVQKQNVYLYQPQFQYHSMAAGNDKTQQIQNIQKNELLQFMRFAKVPVYTDRSGTRASLKFISITIYQYKTEYKMSSRPCAMSGEIPSLLSFFGEQLFLCPSEYVNNVISKSRSCQGWTQAKKTKG